MAPGGDGWLGQLKAHWTDSTTWRGIGYLLARFPVGLVLLVAAGWISEAVAAMSRALARWGT